MLALLKELEHWSLSVFSRKASECEGMWEKNGALASGPNLDMSRARL